MSKHAASSTSPQVWFLSPIAVTWVVALASMLPTALIGDAAFRSLWRTPKSITPETLLLFACGALALSFGALVAMASAQQRPRTVRWPALEGKSLELMRKASTVLTGLTVFGYAGFGFLILRSGLSLSQLIAGPYADGPPVRDTIGTVPGVTTLTQCGMAAVVVSSILLTQQFSRGELLKIIVVIGLSLPRSFLFSERLAVLEVVVPVFVILCAWLSLHPGPRRMAAQLAPVIGFPLVIVVFGVFEYFRSWSYFRTRTNASFVEFTLERLAGYYTTALNNGHLVYQHLDWPGRWPYDTLEAFWVAPGVEQIGLYTRLTGHELPYSGKSTAVTPLTDVLNQYANPEFNNPSGYVAAFIDYGAVGGLIFLFGIGLLAGFLYRGFCSAKPFGLLLYPIIFIGLLELPRYMYWSQGRTTYTLLALIILAVLLRRTQSKPVVPQYQPMLSGLPS
ncbi:O-antigen polymerase [Mycobacterium sp. M26]|uniref:O-antigen polymerase n=1 Tax=Mycobacterium sp. M26 TaxID=1762962 RepID=UPI000AA6995E|nr:O-antigen polymerase [Mycobacterium sp. M26]